MLQKPEELYLDLLKKTLSFALWPQPPLPLTALNSMRSSWKAGLFTVLTKFFSQFKIELAHHRNIPQKDLEQGLFWPGCAHTMIGPKRLDNLQYCVETVLKENIAGDFIETGVWRGGAGILMRAILAVYGVRDRKVYLADSFAGLPKPDKKKYPVDKDDTQYQHDFLAVSQEEVEDNFGKYGMLDDQVVFLKGWFEDTLLSAPVEKLAILRLDGDMYKSTREALEALYPKLSKNGFCIIDDYGQQGCQKATDDFRFQNNITEEMIKVDFTGGYWRKK